MRKENKELFYHIKCGMRQALVYGENALEYFKREGNLSRGKLIEILIETFFSQIEKLLLEKDREIAKLKTQLKKHKNVENEKDN